jgi:hypothetical protein
MVAMSGFESLACEWMSGFSLKLVLRSTNIIEPWFNVKALRELFTVSLASQGRGPVQPRFVSLAIVAFVAASAATFLLEGECA